MSGDATASPLLIDTDPGVDDALALLLAFGSPEVRVVHVTTVAGNARIGIVTANARRLVALAAPASAPAISRGAAAPLERRLVTATHVHGEDGIGGASLLRRADGRALLDVTKAPAARIGASEAIVECARRHGEALTIVALGPLTNIALALEHDAQAMASIGRLVVMGGAVAVGGNVTAAAEFNFFVDPHAAQRVMASGLPITLVPLDVTQRVRLDAAVLRAGLGGARGARARVVRQMLARLLADGGSMAMHDPLAVAVAIRPDLVTTRRMPVAVETQGRLTLGASIADRRASAREGRPVDVALEVDARGALDFFCARALRAGPAPRHAPGIVVVGSANIDLTVASPHLPEPGETVVGGRLHRGFGGKGANQALAAARAGARVGLVAKFGADPDGARYRAHLEREGVGMLGGVASATPTGTAVIIVDDDGENMIAVAGGANRDLAPSDLDALGPGGFDYRVLVAQFEIRPATVSAALRAARERGATTVLNPAPIREIPKAIRRLVDVVVLNRVEAAVLAGAPVDSVADARRAAALLRETDFGAVVVTLGEGGAVWADASSEGHHRAPRRGRVVDTVGAGDTFVGYLAAALAQRAPLADAVRLANRAAALSVTRHGAQPGIPRRAAVDRLRAR